MDLPQWAFGVAVALMLVGLLGVVLPALPGVALIWVVVLVYAIAERFAAIDPLSFSVLTILGLAGATADVWMSQLGAKVGGASFISSLYSFVGGVLGGLIGFLFAGVGAIPGMIVGSILGVLLSEYQKQREWKPAWKATLGMVVGFTLSVLVKFVIGALMLGIFIWQVLRG